MIELNTHIGLPYVNTKDLFIWQKFDILQNYAKIP